jgi:hypothetical protein
MSVHDNYMTDKKEKYQIKCYYLHIYLFQSNSVSLKSALITSSDETNPIKTSNGINLHVFCVHHSTERYVVMYRLMFCALLSFTSFPVVPKVYNPPFLYYESIKAKA